MSILFTLRFTQNIDKKTEKDNYTFTRYQYTGIFYLEV